MVAVVGVKFFVRLDWEMNSSFQSGNYNRFSFEERLKAR
jgi:hypothetical protein